MTELVDLVWRYVAALRSPTEETLAALAPSLDDDVRAAGVFGSGVGREAVLASTAAPVFPFLASTEWEEPVVDGGRITIHGTFPPGFPVARWVGCFSDVHQPCDRQRLRTRSSAVLSVPRAVLIVGAQAAGKTTVGRALAQRCGRGAFIEGDVLWKMVVAGGHDMSAIDDPEAARQLALRYRHGAMLSESFVAAGFTAVHAENIFGATVEEHLLGLRCRRSLVVLHPSPEVIERRERERGSIAYEAWVPPGGALIDAIRQFDTWVAETPRIGLWLDTSAMTVDQTVDEITARWTSTFVDGHRSTPEPPADPPGHGSR